MQSIKIYAFSDEASANIDEQITALRRNGLNGMEIRNVDGINISSISEEKARQVREKLDNSGLFVWSIGSPIGKISIEDDFAEHLEVFKHTLEIAKILDAKNLRLFSFYIPNNQSPDIYRQEVIERLGTFLEIARGYDIVLCHENEKAIYGDIPERCLEIHKSLPELKGIFDPANFVQCNVDTLKAWEMLKPYIHYLHIKDAKKDGFVVPAGNGDGNLKTIVNDFIASGGKDFTIEPHLTIFDGFSELEREDDKSSISEFSYKDSNVAFDVACNAFKGLI